jgi:hypothetical protein
MPVYALLEDPTQRASSSLAGDTSTDAPADSSLLHGVDIAHQLGNQVKPTSNSFGHEA